ncbi:hypothetical protein ES703_117044 [subsurface metagenome]
MSGKLSGGVKIELQAGWTPAGGSAVAISSPAIVTSVVAVVAV